MLGSPRIRQYGVMAITPDTKDWTWVIDRACPECGYDATTTDEHDVAAAIRRNAATWPAVLRRDDVRVRPDDSTWSALEYSAHVRDVYRLYDERLHLMLDQDDPLYPNWDQDAAAVAGRYDEQDPDAVAREIAEAAAALADTFDSVPEQAWSRTGRRSDGARFTIASFAKYLLHDVEHHRWDVRG